MNKQDLPRSQTTAVLISILYSQGQWRQLKSKDLSSAAGSKRLVLVHTDHPVISATLIIYTHLSHQENSTPRTVWRHLNSKEVLDVRTTLVLLQIHKTTQRCQLHAYGLQRQKGGLLTRPTTKWTQFSDDRCRQNWLSTLLNFRNS